jgi:hypothetical protein
MSRRLLSPTAHSLIELLVVVALLGACFAIGGLFLSHGLSAVEARGAAQTWQAAAAWAQTGAAWEGSTSDLEFVSGRVTVAADVALAGGALGASSPAVLATANVVRWRKDQGVVVRFLGGSAYPDSAGSIYFHAPGGDYRVTVRLESGLTVRSRDEAAP